MLDRQGPCGAVKAQVRGEGPVQIIRFSSLPVQIIRLSSLLVQIIRPSFLSWPSRPTGWPAPAPTSRSTGRLRPGPRGGEGRGWGRRAATCRPDTRHAPAAPRPRRRGELTARRVDGGGCRQWRPKETAAMPTRDQIRTQKKRAAKCLNGGLRAGFWRATGRLLGGPRAGFRRAKTRRAIMGRVGGQEGGKEGGQGGIWEG